MFIFGQIATPLVVILKWLAELFLFCSNMFYKLYDVFLGWSIHVNDKTECDVWIRDE